MLPKSQSANATFPEGPPTWPLADEASNLECDGWSSLSISTGFAVGSLLMVRIGFK